MRPRLLHFSILFTCLCLAGVVRTLNYEFFFENFMGHLNFLDTDSYYYLRRLVEFLENFPKISFFDPLSDWPHGSRVDWPPGFLILLGIPLKLIGVDNFRALELGASFLMIVLGIFTAFIFYLCSKRLYKDERINLFVLFLASINFLLVRFTCLGQIDHHILEALFPPLMLLLSLKAFVDKENWASYALGILFAFSLTVSSSSIFMLGTFFGLYAFVLGEKGNTSHYMKTVGVFFALLIPYAIWNYTITGKLTMLTHPSAFHVLLILVLSSSAFLISKFRSKAFIILPVLIALASLAYFYRWPSILIAPIESAFNYVFGRSGVLQNVSEAYPLFMHYGKLRTNFMLLNFGGLIFLLPLVWVFLLFWKKYKTTDRVLLFSLALLFIPGVFQKRFSHIMLGLYLIFIGWMLHQTFEYFKTKKFKYANSIPFLVFIIFGSLMIAPQMRFGFSPSRSSRHTVDFGAAGYFLNKSEIDEKKAWDRLAGKIPVEEGIWANPNLGHLLQYVTGYGVVTNSFYHTSSFNLDLYLRNIEKDKDFKNALIKNKIKYLVLVDDWPFFELEYKLKGRSFEEFIVIHRKKGRTSRSFNLIELKRKAWVRLLMSEEDDTLAGFHLLYSIRFKANHFYKFVRAFRFSDL